MDISPDWTDAERLRAVALLAQRIKDLASTFNPDARRFIWHCADTAVVIAVQSAAFLEANRTQILNDIHRA